MSDWLTAFFYGHINQLPTITTRWSTWQCVGTIFTEHSQAISMTAVQNCSKSSALAMELLQSCTQPSINRYSYRVPVYISQGSISIHVHNNDVIMGAMASQITRLPIVYPTVYSGADQIKHQSSASLAFVRWIHRWPVNFPHKWPVTRKMFPFDDVIMPLWQVYVMAACWRHMASYDLVNIGSYMVWRLTAPSHNVNWRWFIVN